MKRKTLIKTVALFFCLVSGLISAQEKPGEPNDLDKQFVPDKNSIFNSESKSSEGDRSSANLLDVKNIIKFNPTMFFRSIVVFSYQRRFSNNISIEIGLGPCFNKDRMFSFATGMYTDIEIDTNKISLFEIMQNSKTISSSFFTTFSFRLNWKSHFDWDVTPYFEINTRFYSNKLKIANNFNSDVYIIGNQETIVINKSFNLIYGVQRIADGKIKTLHDLYMGIGLRNTLYDSFTKNEGVTAVQPYRFYTKTSKSSQEMALSFIMGYIFGIGF